MCGSSLCGWLYMCVDEASADASVWGGGNTGEKVKKRVREKSVRWVERPSVYRILIMMMRESAKGAGGGKLWGLWMYILRMQIVWVWHTGRDDGVDLYIYAAEKRWSWPQVFYHTDCYCDNWMFLIFFPYNVFSCELQVDCGRLYCRFPWKLRSVRIFYMKSWT